MRLQDSTLAPLIVGVLHNSAVHRPLSAIAVEPLASQSNQALDADCLWLEDRKFAVSAYLLPKFCYQPVLAEVDFHTACYTKAIT